MRYRPAAAPGLGRQLPRKSAARSAYPCPTYPTLLAAGRDPLAPPPAPRSAAATFIFSVKASSVASAAYTASSAALQQRARGVRGSV